MPRLLWHATGKATESNNGRARCNGAAGELSQRLLDDRS